MSHTKFTLSESPFNAGCRSEGGSGLFIICHPRPTSIIEVDLIDTPLPADDTGATFTYTNSDGLTEQWRLTIRHCFQEIGAPDVDVRELLIVAWNWYMNYLAWEDSNIDNDEKTNSA